MIPLFQSTDANPAFASDDSIVEVVDGRSVVKDGNFMFILNGLLSDEAVCQL